MRLGYNTNGCAFHRLADALEILADIGYQAVGVTLDHACLDPYAPGLAREVEQVARLLARYRMSSVVETGARYLLNPRVKHEPTLMSPGPDERDLRLDFLMRAVDVAADIGSDAVSFWSGILHEPITREEGFRRLADGCLRLLDHAARRRVHLAFEPEPGMFIETLAEFDRLCELVDGPGWGLTIDVGHVHCVEDGDIAGHLAACAGRLCNVHIEDMRRGIHEHLRFGEGEIDFRPVVQALSQIGYAGGVYVELSRHSHIAPQVMQESFDFLTRLLPG